MHVRTATLARMKRILVAVILLLAAGCGGSNKPAATVTPPPSTSSTTATPPSAPRTSRYSILNKGRLTSALLQLSDMPPGFTSTSASSGDTHTFCNYKPPYDQKIEVDADFEDSASNKLIGTVIRQYASADQAKAAFNAMVATLKTCKSEKIDGDRGPTTYTAMSVPQVGDETTGVEIGYQGFTLKQNFALVGPVMVSVGGAGVDAGKIADLLGLQVQRYEAAAS